MRLGVFAMVAIQVLGVAVAYGAARIGTSGATRPAKGVEAAAGSSRTPTSRMPATARNEAPSSQLRPCSHGWTAPIDGELIDPWPSRSVSVATWDAAPALQLVEPWEHVAPALAIDDPWPRGAPASSGSAPPAAEPRAFSLLVDPWRTPNADPPTKAFPLLPIHP